MVERWISMNIDNVNSNSSLHIQEDIIIDWTKQKPYDFASNFAQWRKQKGKTDKKSSFTELCTKYNNLLKKEYPNGANVSQKFIDAAFNISGNIGTRKNKTIHCNVNDLLAIIYNESRFDAKLCSKDGKYAGIFQIDKTTYNSIFKNYKCSYEQFKKLPREKQLLFAQDYLKYRIKTAGKGLDKYIDNNGNINGGALYALIWRPGDFETKSDSDISKNVKRKLAVITKVKNKLNSEQSFDKKA